MLSYLQIAIAIVIVVTLLLLRGKSEGMTIDGGVVNYSMVDPYNSHRYGLVKTADQYDYYTQTAYSLAKAYVYSSGKWWSPDDMVIIYSTDVVDVRRQIFPNQYAASKSTSVTNYIRLYNTIPQYNPQSPGMRATGDSYTHYFRHNGIVKHNGRVFIVKHRYMHGVTDLASTSYTGNYIWSTGSFIYRLDENMINMIRGSAPLNEIGISGADFNTLRNFAINYGSYDPLYLYWPHINLSVSASDLVSTLPGKYVPGLDISSFSTDETNCRLRAQVDNAVSYSHIGDTCTLQRGRYTPGVRTGFKTGTGTWGSYANMRLPIGTILNSYTGATEAGCRTRTNTVGGDFYEYTPATYECVSKQLPLITGSTSGFNPTATVSWALPIGVNNWDVIVAPDGATSRVEGNRRRWYSAAVYESWGFPLRKHVSQVDYYFITAGPNMPTYRLPSNVTDGMHIRYNGTIAFVQVGTRRQYPDAFTYRWLGSPGPITDVTEATWHNVKHGLPMARGRYPAGFNENDLVMFESDSDASVTGRLVSGKLMVYEHSVFCAQIFMTMGVKYLEKEFADAFPIGYFEEAAPNLIREGDIIRNNATGAIAKVIGCQRYQYTYAVWVAWGYPKYRDLHPTDYDRIPDSGSPMAPP